MANYDAIANSRPRLLTALRASLSTAATAPISSAQTQECNVESVSLCSIVDMGTTGVTQTTYYQMRGVDPDCILTLTYRSWIVTGSPDYTGAQYSGPRCGVSPLTNVVVVDTWTA